jgi:glucosamine--fructose-6-phosphate aminotransferase (isomerizing)
MLQEIRETPTVTELLLHDGAHELLAAALAIGRFRPDVAVIVGRGTSDNAGTYARYLLELALGVPVALAAASLTTVYRSPTCWRRVLLIALSQSGASPDVVEVTRAARAGGALTIALTNEPASEVAAASEHVIDLRAGQERAVAATKTYVAELAAVASIVLHAADDGTAVRELDRLPDALARTVESAESWLTGGDDPAAEFTSSGRCLVVSRGLNLATAQEIALKLKETSRKFAEGYSSADLMHGPLVLAGADIPTLAIRPDGSMGRSIDAGLARIRAFGGQPWLVGGADMAMMPRALALDLGIAEILTPISYVLPGQLLAEAVSRRCGLDPDAPHGLTKVTRTM